MNCECPKDEFPFPSIHSLIDATMGHEMYSFVDGYVGYNQIKMDPTDAENTAFRTPLDNFMYTIMHLDLKNIGATYQRTMMDIFHDICNKIVESYIDDLVIKSKKEVAHLANLRKVFMQCRKYKFKVNPLNCAFRVTSGKFLMFMVNRQGVQMDLNKKRAIIDMPTP